MSTDDAEGGEPYKVGRNRPPLHTRFTKGRSGNPGGRKKGCLNYKTLLENVLSRHIEVKEGGRLIEMPVGEALILNQVKIALGGEWRLGEAIIDRMERYDPGDAKAELGLPEEDRIVLERAKARWQTPRPAPLPEEPEADDEDATSGHSDEDEDDA